MTGLRVVAAHRRAEIVTALAEGQVIAVPGDGGYQLAVGFGDAAAVARLRAHLSGPAGGVPAHAVVGRREQAVQLAAEWSKETRILTDRMWPGPLTVTVPARADGLAGEKGEPVVHITMPAWRALRALCRAGGPLAVAPLLQADGRPVLTAEDVTSRWAGSDIALVVDGGTCAGPGTTLVDCTVMPPIVRQVGALPEAYVDAALMMGHRRRRRFFR